MSPESRSVTANAIQNPVQLQFVIQGGKFVHQSTDTSCQRPQPASHPLGALTT